IAHRTEAQNSIPKSTKKQAFTDLSEAAVVVRKNGHVLIRRCAEAERWAGLWDFPRFECESEGLHFVHDELVTKVQQQTGITVKPGNLLKTIKHGVTRYRITLDCYEAEFASGRVRSTKHRPLRWTSPAELADLPLSTTGRKIARLIG
ncbi:MAG: NUDIX domain-containing protein, partial [Bythopirellula sp.]